MSVSPSIQQHKVFLQKRPVGDPGGMVPVPMQTPAVAPSVSCSLCTDTFPSAKELGLHILSEHCNTETPGPQHGNQEHLSDTAVTDSLVIEGSPGSMMEVEADQEPETVLQEKPEQPPPVALPTNPPALNLPRQPTETELKQKFMIYRLSDTSCRYICLVCDKMYTSR